MCHQQPQYIDYAMPSTGVDPACPFPEALVTRKRALTLGAEDPCAPPTWKLLVSGWLEGAVLVFGWNLLWDSPWGFPAPLQDCQGGVTSAYRFMKQLLVSGV